MDGTDSPREAACRQLNEQIRRVGVGATVTLTYPPDWDGLDRMGRVLARNRPTPWLSRTLRDHERSLVLDRGGEAPALLVGYEPWHGRSEPILYRKGREGVPVWGVDVVDRGVQVRADRSAAQLYDEVARHDGA